VLSARRGDGSLRSPAVSKMAKERRAALRYPIKLAAFYRTLSKNASISGAGVIRNMSSIGLLIASRDGIDRGTRVEVRMAWPWPLDSGAGLQLVVTGKVVRCEQDSFALAFGKHEFRTRKLNPKSP
jgi:hypothetical protein